MDKVATWRSVEGQPCQTTKEYLQFAGYAAIEAKYEVVSKMLNRSIQSLKGKGGEGNKD